MNHSKERTTKSSTIATAVASSAPFCVRFGNDGRMKSEKGLIETTAPFQEADVMTNPFNILKEIS